MSDGLDAARGREEEIELLLRRWQQSSHGEGQVVLLSGEPGIGKSRLIAALQERIEGEPRPALALLLLAISCRQRPLSHHRATRTGGRVSPARIRRIPSSPSSTPCSRRRRCPVRTAAPG